MNKVTPVINFNNARVKLEHARVHLNNHYIKSFLTALNTVSFARDDNVGTIAHTGRHVLYNEFFVLNTDIDTLSIMLLHDNLHIIAGHPFKLKTNSKHPKVREQVYTKMENDINSFITHINDGCFDEQLCKHIGGNHDHWPTIDKIFNEFDGRCEAIANINVRFQTDLAKVVDIKHSGLFFSNYYTSNNSTLPKIYVGQLQSRVYIARDHDKWIQVSKHNEYVRELIEVFQLAGKISGEYEKL